MQKRLKSYAPRLLTSEKDKNDWNEGKIKVLLAHPASAGHGLNLQKGGNNVIWFGDPDSLELYQQANARLDRQGQVKQVIIQHMATAGTIDEAIAQALIGKADVQEALMQAIKARVKKYRD
jgi:SNF2 family DNA or RNA helicase